MGTTRHQRLLLFDLTHRPDYSSGRSEKLARRSWNLIGNQFFVF